MKSKCCGSMLLHEDIKPKCSFCNSYCEVIEGEWRLITDILKDHDDLKTTNEYFMDKHFHAQTAIEQSFIQVNKELADMYTAYFDLLRQYRIMERDKNVLQDLVNKMENI